MHLLQFHPRIEDTVNSESSIFRRPLSRRISATTEARDIFFGYASPKEVQASARVDESPLPVILEPGQIERKDSGNVFKVEIPGELIPKNLKRSPETGKHTDGQPSKPGTYLAIKTYGQTVRDCFKSEWDIFRLLRNSLSTISKLVARWDDDGVQLEFAGGSNGGNDGGGRNASAPQCSSNFQNGRGKKRSSRRDDDVSDEERGNGSDGHGDDRKGDRTTGGGAKRQRATEEKRRLACPYFKHDPVKFNRSTCCGPGFTTVHRVKEHVFRRHVPPSYYCDRCRSPFNTGADLVEHLRSWTPCEISEAVDEERCTLVQQEQLKARRRHSSALTEEDRWRAVYSILFPEDMPIPSPYYDDITLLDKRPAQDVDKLAEHLHRELPTQLRQALEAEVEKEFGIIEEVMRTRMSDIVQKVSQRIFETFRGSESNNASSSSTVVTDEPSLSSISGDCSGAATSAAAELPIISPTSNSMSNIPTSMPPPYAMREEPEPAKWNDFDFESFLHPIPNADDTVDYQHLQVLFEQNAVPLACNSSFFQPTVPERHQ
ncbi:hypothetical protein GE09DRAFT_1194988 [Coniochaeta sp. 2T2.1]|nr:hypothetical protein GE09DRAFT_1194988 [Coniochaeta sp. 2T2.1]